MTDQPITLLPNHIRELRVARRINQRALARMARVSVWQLSRWELGKGLPTLTGAYDLAATLQVPIDDLGLDVQIEQARVREGVQ